MKRLPIILLFVIIAAIAAFVLMVPGCANLPPSPTPTQIQAAQQSLAVQQLAYTAVTTPILMNLKGADRTKALAANAVVQQVFQNAQADAAAGRNINTIDIMQAIVQAENTILALQNAPATQP